MIAPADLDVFLQARAALCDDRIMPYLRAILLRMIPVPVAGAGTVVACDERFRVFFDPVEFRRVGLAQAAADVCHEAVVHLYPGHPARTRDAGWTSPEDARRANVAGDCAGNSTVAALAAKHPAAIRPGGAIFKAPDDADARAKSGWLWPEHLNLPPGETMEQYYHLLLQQSQPRSRPSQGQGQGQGQPSPSRPKPGAGQPQPGGQPAPGTGPGQPAPGPAKPGHGVGQGHCGTCAAAGPEDGPLAAVRAAAEAQHGPLPQGPDEAEAKELRQEVAEAIRAHEAQHGRGSVPAGLRVIADGILAPPVVDWRTVLAAAIRAGVGRARGSSDYGWSRPRWHAGLALPRLHAPAGRVAVVGDTSGSMGGGELLRVLSEVAGVLRSGAVESVSWIPTDAEAHAVVRQLVDVRQARAKLLGGGGTDMGTGLAAACRLRPRPHLTVVATDGATPWPEARPEGCGRVIVVVVGGGRPGPDWARTIRVPPARKEGRP